MRKPGDVRDKSPRWAATPTRRPARASSVTRSAIRFRLPRARPCERNQSQSAAAKATDAMNAACTRLV